ncbi:MAG: hypothetical protein HUU57_04945 [Bdellovibrio sp.]|nr:hypothetical protein [Bdellovibrio sp.]
MKSRFMSAFFAFIFLTTSSTFGSSIHGYDRFDTEVLFPESSSCSTSSFGGAPNFSSEGYCMVGSASYRAEESNPNLNKGLYFVFFYKNEKTGDKVAYFTSVQDKKIQARMISEVETPNGKQLISFEGVTNVDSNGSLNDFLNSPTGQAVMGGMAQGFVKAFQYTQTTENIKNNEIAAYSVSGNHQVQINIKVNSFVEDTKKNLGKSLLENLIQTSQVSIDIPVGEIIPDKTLLESYIQDSFNSYVDGRYEKFLKIQGIVAQIDGRNFSVNNDLFYQDGKSKMFGPSSPNLKSDNRNFIQSTNALSLVPLSAGQGVSIHQRKWILAQRLHHLAGIINQRLGNFPESAKDYIVSVELSKLSNNIASAARLDSDENGSLVPHKNGDFKRYYFSEKNNTLALDSAINSIASNPNSRPLSQDAISRIEMFEEVGNRLKEAFPEVYGQWSKAVTASNDLLKQAKIEASRGNIEIALAMGEMSVNVLDVLSYFTPVGTAESLLNLISGKNIRTGQTLTATETIIETLQIVPSQWLISAGKFGVGTLAGIIEKINPKSAKAIAENAARIERVAKYIPASLAAKKEKLEAAIAEIERLTPQGEDWTLKVEKILAPFSKLKDFNPEVLFDVIKQRDLLSKIRDGYNSDIKIISVYVSSAKSKGETWENMARECNRIRRSIGEKYKNLTPEPLRFEIYKRNIIKYEGDPLGPKFEDMVAKGVADGLDLETIYKNIVDSSQTPNVHLNNLLEAIQKELP